MRITRRAATSTAAPSEWITGDVWIESVTELGEAARNQVESARFAPGSRTIWHRHPFEQVLVITEGTGRVQRHGGPVETVHAGDTVHIAAGEWHWHGAAPTTAMTHLAIEPVPDAAAATEAGPAVTDTEYLADAPASAASDTSASAASDADADVEAEAEAEEHLSGAPEHAPDAQEHAADADEQAPDGGDIAPVTRVVLLDQALPTPLRTQHVEIRRISIAPGHAAGLHVHNGPVFGSIENGSAIYQVEGEAPSTLRPGDVFYEPEGVRVARFDAEGDGVTFLAYFPLAADQASEIEFPDR